MATTRTSRDRAPRRGRWRRTLRLRGLATNPAVLLVLILGFGLTFFSVQTSQRQARLESRAWLDDRGSLVESAVRDNTEQVIQSLRATAAFFENSSHVTLEEFRGFVSSFGDQSSVLGIAYVPIVSGSERAAFEESVGRDLPGYEITELGVVDGVEDLVPAEQRDLYYPVKYFYGMELFDSSVSQLAAQTGLEIAGTADALGFDAGSDDDWRNSLEAALASDGPAVSDFMAIDEIPLDASVFLVWVPVHGSSGEVQAFTGALVLDLLLTTEAGDAVSSVAWRVTNPGEEVRFHWDPAPWVWTNRIEMVDREWEITVAPNRATAGTIGAGVPFPAAILGIAVTLLCAVALHLAMQRVKATRKMQRLEQMAEEKDRFLASISHEIRTPLTAVSGLAHELVERAEEFDSQERDSLLEVIAEQSDDVEHIVEDLLVGARSDIGSLKVRPQILDLHYEAASVTAATGAPMNASGVATAAWADPKRVRQVLRNLVTNAQRYGGPTIAVHVCSADGWATATVADDGDGIPEPYADKIFGAYTSAHPDADRLGSIGLGLFISRKLATLMEGELFYERAEGWTLFRLRLPLGPPDYRAVSSAGNESPEPLLQRTGS